jgi:UDP-N-acetylglucosamine/UDP-N-acetylgalactosamine diphosphorylase
MADDEARPVKKSKASFETALEIANQGHIVSEYFPELSPNDAIFQDLFHNFNIEESLEKFRVAKASTENSKSDDFNTISPPPSFNWLTTDVQERSSVESIGLEAIKSGTVAAVILSGGQGTRLGFAGPKGMFPISPQSHKTIFQLHIERLSRIQSLSGCLDLPVYIMTSDLNDQTIRSFFSENNFFGFPERNIFFFEQGLELCLTLDGKLIVESETSLAKAPDGNGGLYSALKKSGAIDDMFSRGVKHLHVYGIDNVLTRSVDPAFIGLCIREHAQCGNKVVWRASKAEKVGVTVSHKGRMKILEYSEIPSALADAVDEESGKLLYGAGNICNHYLSLPFIIDVVLPNLSGTYHIAEKKIPFLNPITRTLVKPVKNNGYKLEMFVFDVFPQAERWLVMEVDREAEFAPVKNEPGNPQDSPDTARKLMSAQAIRWLRAAGAKVVEPSGDGDDDGKIVADGLCELSPLVSYSGEGLESYKDKEVVLPLYVE